MSVCDTSDNSNCRMNENHQLDGLRVQRPPEGFRSFRSSNPDRRRERIRELTRQRVQRHRAARRGHEHYRIEDSTSNPDDQKNAHDRINSSGPSTSSQQLFVPMCAQQPATLKKKSPNSSETSSEDGTANIRTSNGSIIEQTENEVSRESDERNGSENGDISSEAEEIDSEVDWLSTDDEFGAEDANEDGDFDEAEELRKWALSSNPPIAHTRLDSLLNILRRRLLPNLPKSAKTFLKTETTHRPEKLDDNDNGEFIYFGLTPSLLRVINTELHKNAFIELIINVDGLPLFKSSSKQFWPILGKVYHKSILYQPFPIAIWCGSGKPGNLQKYLEKFIEEINQLQANGLFVNVRYYLVKIKAFICDRPARAFLKCIKGHGGYFACERCCVRGEYVANRVIYPIENLQLRTDESFREQQNREHHHALSPLLKINPPIDLIRSFTLDSMHLVYLGVMKKLLHYWLHGDVNIRMGYNAKSQLTQLLVLLQKQIPQEFQRTTRSLAEVERFKATEFQFLILYAAPVIFSKTLSARAHKNLLLLHVACRILCSKELAIKYCQNAKIFLTSFVVLAPKFYKIECLSGNMHNLIHLADDVEYMKCPLSDMNAFPFENTLGKMKRLIRNGNKPLAQICRRLQEIDCLQQEKTAIKQGATKIIHKLQPDLSGKTTVKRVQYKGVILTPTSPNNTVFLNSGVVLEINDIYIPPNHHAIVISGIFLTKKKSIFTYPCDSEDLKMWVVSKKNASTMRCGLNEVLQKMVSLDISEQRCEKNFVMPLLHM